jgi:hypothetical protein
MVGERQGWINCGGNGNFCRTDRGPTIQDFLSYLAGTQRVFAA